MPEFQVTFLAAQRTSTFRNYSRMYVNVYQQNTVGILESFSFSKLLFWQQSPPLKKKSHSCAQRYCMFLMSHLIPSYSTSLSKAE